MIIDWMKGERKHTHTQTHTKPNHERKIRAHPDVQRTWPTCIIRIHSYNHYCENTLLNRFLRHIQICLAGFRLLPQLQHITAIGGIGLEPDRNKLYSYKRRLHLLLRSTHSEGKPCVYPKVVQDTKRYSSDNVRYLPPFLDG